MAKEKEKMSKTAAVKEALHEGVKSNPEIVEYAKTKHGIDIDAKYVSIIKSGVKKAGSTAPGAGPGRKRAATASANGGISLQDLEAVKGLVGRLGKDTVRRLVEFAG
jgi:hypothetical protein